jgi:UDP-N-acetylmuramoyl-L-alanyl-D-glutamate-L-lysine ligase
MAFVARKFFQNPNVRRNQIGATGMNGKITTMYRCRAMLNAISKTGILETIADGVYGNTRQVSNTGPTAIILLQMLVEAVQNRSKTPPVEMTSHT